MSSDLEVPVLTPGFATSLVTPGQGGQFSVDKASGSKPWMTGSSSFLTWSVDGAYNDELAVQTPRSVKDVAVSTPGLQGVLTFWHQYLFTQDTTTDHIARVSCQAGLTAQQCKYWSSLFSYIMTSLLWAV